VPRKAPSPKHTYAKVSPDLSIKRQHPTVYRSKRLPLGPVLCVLTRRQSRSDVYRATNQMQKYSHEPNQRVKILPLHEPGHKDLHSISQRQQDRHDVSQGAKAGLMTVKAPKVGIVSATAQRLAMHWRLRGQVNWFVPRHGSHLCLCPLPLPSRLPVKLSQKSPQRKRKWRVGAERIPLPTTSLVPASSTPPHAAIFRYFRPFFFLLLPTFAGSFAAGAAAMAPGGAPGIEGPAPACPGFFPSLPGWRRTSSAIRFISAFPAWMAAPIEGHLHNTSAVTHVAQ
jgi:hypothetical protein